MLCSVLAAQPTSLESRNRENGAGSCGDSNSDTIGGGGRRLAIIRGGGISQEFDSKISNESFSSL